MEARSTTIYAILPFKSTGTHVLICLFSLSFFLVMKSLLLSRSLSVFLSRSRDCRQTGCEVAHRWTEFSRRMLWNLSRWILGVGGWASIYIYMYETTHTYTYSNTYIRVYICIKREIDGESERDRERERKLFAIHRLAFFGFSSQVIEGPTSFGSPRSSRQLPSSLAVLYITTPYSIKPYIQA